MWFILPFWLCDGSQSHAGDEITYFIDENMAMKVKPNRKGAIWVWDVVLPLNKPRWSIVTGDDDADDIWGAKTVLGSLEG